MTHAHASTLVAPGLVGLQAVVDTSVPDGAFLPMSDAMRDLVARATEQGATIAARAATWSPLNIALSDDDIDNLTTWRTRVTPRLATMARAVVTSILKSLIGKATSEGANEYASATLRPDESGWYEVAITPMTGSDLASQHVLGAEVVRTVHDMSWRMTDQHHTSTQDACLYLQLVCECIADGTVTLDGLSVEIVDRSITVRLAH